MNTEQELESGTEQTTNVHANTGTAEPLSPQDERTWAMVAHLSVLLNLVTGFLGVIGALVIYMLYKDRSRYVAYQAMQAFLFQLIFWGLGGLAAGTLIAITWSIVGALSVIIIGIFLIPVAVILTVVFLALPLLAIVYGIIGGIRCTNGEDFRYWLVSEWALSMM